MNVPRVDRIGPYRLEGRLGVGGMGEVYRAYDERLGRWVAIKLIRPDVAGHDKARERFRREARAAACLNHRAIVQIHDILLSDAGDAIVMEIVEGPTLADRLSSGPLELSSALRIALTIAEGLVAAHTEGIVHRDLKTENVVITPAGDAKILDFGVAKRFRRADEEANLSIDGALVGTLKAMSPEQARGWRLDHRSDLFSFGTLLYEMLTGSPPFTGDGALDILTKICAWRPPPVNEVNPEAPEALSDLIERLMEKDCSRRPQSAEEVAAALKEITGVPAGNHVWASPPTTSDGGPTLVDVPWRARTIRPRSRRKRVALQLFRALALALGCLAIFPQDRWQPQEIKILRQQVRRGDSLDDLYKLVGKEKKRGDFDWACRDLQDFLSKDPYNPYALAWLAEIELGYGDPQDATVLYSQIPIPQFDDLINLGTAYLVAKKYTYAKTTFAKALNQFPKDPTPGAVLSLADSTGILGSTGTLGDNVVGDTEMYERVLTLADKSPETGEPKYWSIRAQASAHLHKEQAESDARKALSLLGPEGDAEVWYEVSLVFTLVGDYKPALQYAKLAHDKGIAPGWFEFNWFEPLKRNPDFQELLKPRGWRGWFGC